MFYDRKKFFDGVRTTLTKDGKLTQDQVDGFEILLAEGERRNVNTEWIAYILATAWHETAYTMQPVRESLADTDAQAISRLNRAWADGKMSWVKTPYWRTGYFGRGYVQLTHKFNYEKMGGFLGLDLVGNPSLALEADTAAKIIYEGMLRGMFTAKKLSDYLDGYDDVEAEDLKEYMAARAVVNGKDKARKIALEAVKFENALRKAEVFQLEKPEAPKPSAKPAPQKPAPAPTTAPEVVLPKAPQNEGKPGLKSTTIWSALATLVTTVVGILTNLNPVIQGILIVLVFGFIFWIIRERLKGNSNIDNIF